MARWDCTGVPARRSSRAPGSHFPLAGKDTFTYTFDRSTQVPAGAPKEGEAAQMKTKYGALNIKADYHATKNVGEMAKVKNDLADKALAGWGE